jgi:hypothetical protein
LSPDRLLGCGENADVAPSINNAGDHEMSIVQELLDDAIALQKDGVSPARIGLALTDRWEAEDLGAAGKVKRTRSPSGAMELLFPSGEKIVWNGTVWSYIPA